MVRYQVRSIVPHDNYENLDFMLSMINANTLFDFMLSMINASTLFRYWMGKIPKKTMEHFNADEIKYDSKHIVLKQLPVSG